LLAVEIVLLVAGAGVAAVFGTAGHWQGMTVVILAVFSALSDRMLLQAGSRMAISGSFLGIILAAVLVGGTAGASVGVATILCDVLMARDRWLSNLNNLTTYIWFPLLAGLTFHGLTTATGATAGSPAFYLLIFAAFNVGLAANFFGVAVPTSWLHREPVMDKVRDVLVPVLPAELASALLTLGAVFVYRGLGNAGLILAALVFIVYQYLVGEMLTSKRRREKLQRIATTDELTGLINREHFRTVIGKRIAEAAAADREFSVLLMDLDHFKEINDTLGHHHGDVLLQELVPRLTRAVGEDGIVARLGGDEFGILLGAGHEPSRLDGQLDLDGLDHTLRGLFAAVCQPFVVDVLSLEVSASLGVARFPHDGADSATLLRCADIAMYAAKDAQVDYKLYDAEQNESSVRRLSVLSDIRRALIEGEIVVHYQPIVDLSARRVVAAEALVRWQHPVHGLIPPGAFVETVEQTGLIEPLTRHVLESAIGQCASWRRAGRELSVAVNLSVRNLLDNELPGQIAELLSAHQVPAEALQLEITESMIMSDPARALETVSRLSALGLRLSVDDFGTGYSSLANLRKMPISELKIDRSFVSPMLRDESDLIIVRSTINLGHDLGLSVIAEGVEDAATLEHLRSLGCDLVQGYHVSRPMAAPDFESWLDNDPLHARPNPAAHVPAAVRQLRDIPLVPGVGHGGLDLAGLTFRTPEDI
jgi:diguanylate cyclase (GGDEF)-like protein